MEEKEIKKDEEQKEQKIDSNISVLTIDVAEIIQQSEHLQ